MVNSDTKIFILDNIVKIDPLKPREPAVKFQPQNEDPGDGREQCNYCGRWFMPDRLEKHEDACYKVSMVSRVLFNS